MAEGNVNADEDTISEADDKETYNIAIKNVPKPSVKTIRSLRAWIVQLTGETSVSVTFSGMSHFAHFVNVSIGLEEMIDILKNTAYNGLTLDVEEVKIVKQIHVSNLREAVTEDEITLYFEQSHFQPKNLKEGEEYYVSVMHLDRKKKFALVKLPESADVSLYVNATHSNILGDGIKVVDGKTNRRSRQKTWKEWKQHGGRQRNMLDRPGKNGFAGSVEVLAGVTGDGKNVAASRDHSAKSQRSECSGGNDRGGESHDIKNTPRANNDRRHQRRQPAPAHRQHHVNKPPNNTFAHKLVKKGIDYRSEMDGCQIRMIIRLDDELGKEKGELLRKFIKLLTRKFEDKNWKIWIDFGNLEVHLGHPDDEQILEEIADHIKGLMALAQSCDVNLPQPLADICSLYFSSIKILLISFLNQHDIQVIPYLNSSGVLNVLAENEEEATKAAKFFEESYKERFITVTGDQSDPPVQNFLTPKWENFMTDLARRFFIDVSVKTDDPETILISLVGLNDNKLFTGAIIEIKKEIATMGGCVVSVIGDARDENTNYTKHHKRENFEHNKRFLQQMQNKSRINSTNSNLKDRASGQKPFSAKKCPLAEGEGKSNIQDDDDKIIIKMSPLEFRYLKLGLPNIICSEVQYNSIRSCLEIRGIEESRNDKKKIIEETMSMFVKKDFHYSMPGITYSFYKEENSPLKTLLTCLEKDVKCVFDVSPSTEDSGIVVHCIGSFSSIRSVEDTLANALRKMIDEKIISYSFILKKSAKNGNTVGEVANRRMDGRLVKEITNRANENVSISIDEKSETVVLKGRKIHVSKAETFINNLFLNYLKKAPLHHQEDKPSILTLDSPLRQRNLSEFLKSYGHQDIQAPAHWQSYQGSLRSHSSNKGVLTELDKGSTLFNIISCMVYDSWSDDGTFMFDASSTFKDPITIEKIYSIENVHLYKRYMTKINEFCLQNHDKIGGLSKQTISIRTRKLTDGEPLLLHEINECYLFHGTDAVNRQAIIDQGLDFRLGSSRSLFGKGIYFAESCTKAHYYAEQKPNEDTYNIFVARVFLGNMHHCDSSHPYKRPPCSDPSCHSDTCHIHPLCDSVMGTNTYNDRLTRCVALRNRRDDLMTSANPSNLTEELNSVNEGLKKLGKYLFREFIVYDQSQCYPEFLVEYRKT